MNPPGDKLGIFEEKLGKVASFGEMVVFSVDEFRNISKNRPTSTNSHVFEKKKYSRFKLGLT